MTRVTRVVAGIRPRNSAQPAPSYIAIMAAADVETGRMVVDGGATAGGRSGELVSIQPRLSDGETTGKESVTASTWDWSNDPSNPYNWPLRRKWAQVS